MQVYGTEEATTEGELVSLHAREQTCPEEIASRLETVAASWDQAAPEEWQEMIRMIFDVEYCHPAKQ